MKSSSVRWDPTRERSSFEGEAGIGKTTLWRHALTVASRRGWFVLSTQTAQSEVRWTYVALNDLVAGIPTFALAGLPGFQRRALEVASQRAEPDEGAVTQHAVAAAFLSALQALADHGPVLVAIDDAHWLDSASAAVLEFAAPRLDGHPVALLFTQRDGEREPFSFQQVCPRLLRVEVGPLASGSLRELIRERTNERLSRRRLAEVKRLSGGNPLFALELARAWAGVEGGDDATPPLPATLGDALLEQIKALPGPTRDALLVAALLARPALRNVNAEAIAVAEEAGVVRAGADNTITFAHPLFAWAVLASASTAQRRAAHARAALEARSREEEVRHLALAASVPSRELAADLEQLSGDGARPRSARRGVRAPDACASTRPAQRRRHLGAPLRAGDFAPA